MRHRALTASMIATVSLAGFATPALASSKAKHWSSAQCKSYRASLLKHHAHPTTSQKTAANKTLKSWSCTIKA